MMELVILLSLIILIHLVVIKKWQCEGITLKCCSPKAPRSFQGVSHMLLRGCHCVPLALAGFIFKCLLLLFLFAPAHVWWLQEEIRGRQKPSCPSSENEVTTLRMKCELLRDALTPCGVGGGGSSQGAPSEQVSFALLEQWCSPGQQDHSISDLQTPPALQNQQAPHKAEGLSLESFRTENLMNTFLLRLSHRRLPQKLFSRCDEFVFLPSALWLRSRCWAAAWQGIA